MSQEIQALSTGLPRLYNVLRINVSLAKGWERNEKRVTRGPLGLDAVGAQWEPLLVPLPRKAKSLRTPLRTALDGYDVGGA